MGFGSTLLPRSLRPAQVRIPTNTPAHFPTTPLVTLPRRHPSRVRRRFCRAFRDEEPRRRTPLPQDPRPSQARSLLTSNREHALCLPHLNHLAVNFWPHRAAHDPPPNPLCRHRRELLARLRFSAHCAPTSRKRACSASSSLHGPSLHLLLPRPTIHGPV